MTEVSVYAFSKAIGSQDSDRDGAGVAPLQNSSFDRGRASYDRNDRCAVPVTYQLPLGWGTRFPKPSGVWNHLFGGHEISLTEVAETGNGLSFSFANSPYSSHPKFAEHQHLDVIAAPGIWDNRPDLDKDRFNTNNVHAVMNMNVLAYAAVFTGNAGSTPRLYCGPERPFGTLSSVAYGALCGSFFSNELAIPIDVLGRRLGKGQAMEQITRRELVGAGVGLSLAAGTGGLNGWPLEQAMALPIERLAENIPTTILGRTQWKSKVIGLGTIFRPETKWTTKESDGLLNTLIDNGINLIEIGVVYKDSEERVGRILPKRRRDELFISSKSTKITKEGFMKQLEASLVKLNTDHVDCYMLHNYSTFVEYERVMGPGGAFEALLEAQKQGKTRFIGITSHGCPVTMAAMRSGKFDVFVVPYNAAHREFGRALDLAAKLQAGVLIMKPLGGSGLVKYNTKDPLQLPQTLTVEESLRYALSHPGARVAIPNMSTMEHVKVALAAAATLKPLTPEEKQTIEAKAARIVGGVCSGCQKPCDDACPNQVPVSLLMSRVQEMHRLGYDNRRQGDLYAVLPHDFMDCDGCGKCEEVCPKGFSVRKELEKYDRTYRESRYKDVLQFEKVYR